MPGDSLARPSPDQNPPLAAVEVLARLGDASLLHWLRKYLKYGIAAPAPSWAPDDSPENGLVDLRRSGLSVNSGLNPDETEPLFRERIPQMLAKLLGEWIEADGIRYLRTLLTAVGAFDADNCEETLLAMLNSEDFRLLTRRDPEAPSLVLADLLDIAEKKNDMELRDIVLKRCEDLIRDPMYAALCFLELTNEDPIRWLDYLPWLLLSKEEVPALKLHRVLERFFRGHREQLLAEPQVQALATLQRIGYQKAGISGSVSLLQLYSSALNRCRVYVQVVPGVETSEGMPLPESAWGLNLYNDREDALKPFVPISVAELPDDLWLFLQRARDKRPLALPPLLALSVVARLIRKRNLKRRML